MTILVIVALVMLMIIAPCPQYRHLTLVLVGVAIALVTAEKNKPGTNAYYEDFAETQVEFVESDNKLAKALAYSFTINGTLADFDKIVSEVRATDFIRAMHTMVEYQFPFGWDEALPIQILMWEVQYTTLKDAENNSLRSYQLRMHHFFNVYFEKLKETGMTPVDNFEWELDDKYRTVEDHSKITLNPFERVKAMYEEYKFPIPEAKRGREDFDSMMGDFSKKMRLG